MHLLIQMHPASAPLNLASGAGENGILGTSGLRHAKCIREGGNSVIYSS